MSKQIAEAMRSRVGVYRVKKPQQKGKGWGKHKGFGAGPSPTAAEGEREEGMGREHSPFL